MLHINNSTRAMEPETIQKNGTSMKSYKRGKTFLKVFFLFLVSITFCIRASAQSELTYKEGLFGGIRLNGKMLSTPQVYRVMAGNSEATKEYTSGKVNGMVSAAVGGTGFALLLFGVVFTASEMEEIGIPCLAMGVVAGGAGVYLGSLSAKKIKNSVQLYNSKANNELTYRMTLGFTSNGLGLNVRF